MEDGRSNAPTAAPQILEEQIAYYRARAPEYDEWFLREGRYDHGPQHRQRWFDEVRAVEEALAGAAPSGDILEIACGTGIWTRALAPRATKLTALDASPEVIAINKSRSQSANINYEQADIFQWTPSEDYDFIFFGFWLSHVPPALFEDFWHKVRSALRPNGKVFFVDSLGSQEGTARDQPLESTGAVNRRLNDGRTFRIVKVFYDPNDLANRLATLGWTADIRTTPSFFLYGSCRL